MRYRDEYRQLAAIMFTDIVGYTSLMSADESRALRALKHSRKVVQKFARRHGGRWLESIGDGNLVRFHSATDAVNCALRLQRAMDGEDGLQLRIGLHVGDVIEASGHIYGDGVNVASRIHALAEPGGIVVSEPVYDAVRNKAGIVVDHLGVREIKGLDHPIQVYALAGEGVDNPLLGAIDLPGRPRWMAIITVIVLALVAVVSAGIYSQYANVGAGDASIAVLPFEDLSPDSDSRYFSEGISEELINGLSRVPGLRVVGRSSSFAYGERELDVRTIGDELNVTHVLDGSVRRAAERVRISAQLVNTESGFQLWTDTYEAEIDDIFELQQNISQSIVEALRIELMPEELANVGNINTNDVKAYDLYLQARRVLRTATSRDDYDEALEVLGKALRRDPMFAEAEAARCEAFVERYKQTRDADSLAPAVETCNRALNMDSRAPQAHIALGVLYMATGRTAFAIESYAKALPLDPDNANIHMGLAGALASQGRIDDAEAYYEVAIDLKPDDAVIYQKFGAALANAGRYDRAESMLRKAIMLGPEDARSYSHLGAVLYFQGRFAEAAGAFMRANEIQPYDKAYNNIGALLFYAGEYERSMEMLRKAMEMTPHDPRIVGGVADACRLASGCREWRALYGKALDLADERLRVNPEDAHVLALKGVYHSFLGRVDAGREFVEAAVRMAPDHREVMLNAAIFWSIAGDLGKAGKFVERAKALGYPESELKRHPDIAFASSRSEQ